MVRKTVYFLAVACAFTFSLASHAEVAGSKSARALITQKIDENKLVTLYGNTRPEALHAKNDRGAVAVTTEMPSMQLLLKRSPEQEKALLALLDKLQTPGNPLYHQWLTPDEFRETFGVSQQDVATVKQWLTEQGFTVTGATPTGLQIEFTGTVAKVNAAFHTEIHNIADRQGEVHMANISDPKIPAALAAVVVGPTTLNTFPPHNYTKRVVKPEYTFTSGGNTYEALVAGDIQTIYNTTPFYTAGYTGKGATIGFLEDTPVYKSTDFTTYQSTFGLSSYGGTLVNTNPAKPASGGVTCTAATDNSDDVEAELDVEMGIAVAPGATIVNENCKDTTVFGGLLAYENLENSTTFPQVISMSYGECEAYSGASQNASFSTAFQQGATEGISTFVSAGDNSAASCDQASATRTNDEYWNAYGLGITGWGDSPYNVAVGGTDFADNYYGTAANYWNSTNSSTYESAKSYIPEIPWNDSCASQLLANLILGPGATTYGANGLCNNSTYGVAGELLESVGGGGGFSTCYSGSASTSYVVSGTCAGVAQPTWQKGLVGVPTATPAYGTLAASSTPTRTIPDVSLFAANGVWGHFITICYSHVADGGVACTGAPSGWVGIGGTSASAPMMAAIQTLVNQYTAGTTNGNGTKAGNPNPTYYQIAKYVYGAHGSDVCNSEAQGGPASSCIFNDVTLGDNNTDCRGSYNCYIPSGTNGVATTVSGSYVPAFNTGAGYDLATGIGSVNAWNLAKGWNANFLTFSAVSHNFGSIAEGSRSSGTGNFGVQLVNNSSTTLSWTGVAFSGSSAFSLQGTTCSNTIGSGAGSLAAGKTCELVFQFGPSTLGSQSATWSLTGATTNVAFGPANGGTLTGTGIGGSVTITTNGHNFGAVTVGSTSATFGAVITNGTSSAVTLTVGTTTAPFHVVLNNCPSSLASGATCNLQWSFTPTAKGGVSENVPLTASQPIEFGTTPVTSMYLAGTGQ